MWFDPYTLSRSGFYESLAVMTTVPKAKSRPRAHRNQTKRPPTNAARDEPGAIGHKALSDNAVKEFFSGNRRRSRPK